MYKKYVMKAYATVVMIILVRRVNNEFIGNILSDKYVIITTQIIVGIDFMISFQKATMSILIFFWK